MLRALAPALAALAALGLVLGGAAWGLATAGARVALLETLADPYVGAVLRFSLLQAGLAALLSVAFAMPVARAFARRPVFRGRNFILRMMGLPMATPTIVGVLGVIAVYGRSGYLNDAAAALGAPLGLDIYGLGGILLAHLFFNMTFAARLLLQGWAGVPGESWRLAAQLGMTGPQIFRLIEWPMLRRILPGVAGLIFLLCFTSFSVVLILGGGPPAATLEVAIYQALRVDFDLSRAVALAILQVGVCALLVGFGGRLARAVPPERGLGRLALRPDAAGTAARILDVVLIVAATAFLLAPLAAIVAAAAAGPVAAVLTDSALWRAAGRSLAVALSAGGLALAMGWGLLATSRELRVRYARPRAAERLELAGSLAIVAPPFVVGAGLFVLLRPVADVFAIGLALVVVVNSLMALPFVIRILGPAAAEVHERHLRLADSLGMGAFDRLRLVDWPLLRRPAGVALGLGAALSMGDFGVIALFGTRDTQTLPLLLYGQMGSYRSDEAAVTALVLVLLCLILFLVIEKGIGGRVRTGD